MRACLKADRGTPFRTAIEGGGGQKPAPLPVVYLSFPIFFRELAMTPAERIASEMTPEDRAQLLHLFRPGEVIVGPWETWVENGLVAETADGADYCFTALASEVVACLTPPRAPSKPDGSTDYVVELSDGRRIRWTVTATSCRAKVEPKPRRAPFPNPEPMAYRPKW